MSLLAKASFGSGLSERVSESEEEPDASKSGVSSPMGTSGTSETSSASASSSPSSGGSPRFPASESSPEEAASFTASSVSCRASCTFFFLTRMKIRLLPLDFSSTSKFSPSAGAPAANPTTPSGARIVP